MRKGSYKSILRIVLHGRSAVKILLATVMSFAFSIAVILCTFGLMDGFDHLLKSGLRHSSGDILITSRRGFFPVTEKLEMAISKAKPRAVSPVIQTEAFALFKGESRGVMVRGVEPLNFSKATGLQIDIPTGGIIVGEELALQLNLSVGDDLALTLGRGNESSQGLPSVQVFQVAGTVKHGIYQKDLRFVYLNRNDLAGLLNVGEWVNLLIIGTEDPARPLKELAQIERAQAAIRGELESSFIIRPFWSEYSFLIEAVKVEKLSISLILQLIVVVAVFNIIAFVIYIMEKKSQEFFFLRAVGMDLKKLMSFWLNSILIIWLVSCMLAHLLAQMFNWSLANISYFQIPGEIYVLSSLSIKLDWQAYLTVYAVSLLWILLAAFIGYWRIKQKPIIQGLRQEFSA